MSDLIVHIREFFRPRLKCERLGCASVMTEIDGYAKPKEYRYYVAVNAKKVRYACPRCGHIHSESIVETGGGFTGYSWPKYMADEFNKTGFVRGEQ